MIGHVKRGEQYQSVAVNILLDFVSRLKNGADQFFIFRLKQDGDVLRGQAFELVSFVDDLADVKRVGILRPIQNVLNGIVVNEILHGVLLSFNEI